MKKRVPRICLVSSSGGHFEQLLMLRKLSEKYNVFIVTEKTKYNKNIIGYLVANSFLLPKNNLSGCLKNKPP